MPGMFGIRDPIDRALAYALTVPAPLRRIFRSIADGVFMADVPPALHRVNQHCIDSKLLPLPELLTADEQPMFKEFRQLVGAHQRIVVSASFNIGVKRNGR
ncbi:hypothetical protein MRX96_023076 [Rhipicephalus microplus]